MTEVDALIEELRAIGARAEPTGGNILLRAGTTAIPSQLVSRLREAKPVLLLRLTQSAQGSPLSAIADQDAPRTPTSLEPSTERRGRFEFRESGWLHFCVECGRWGGFGCGVDLRSGRLGQWYCAEHRPQRSPVDAKSEAD